MKYIRTKDGIFRLLQYGSKRKHYVCVFDNKTLGRKEYDTNEIIAQADTIEELCDKYYGVEENGDVEKVFNWSKDAWPIKPHEWAVEGFCTKEDITIDELKNRFPKGIFGAVVWFDSKGNLHIDIVAKMNEKGYLELL